MDHSDEDIRLMLRFQQGEEACFEELVERHKQRVFNLAYRFLGNYEEAEDLAQEIFIRVYRAKDAYRPEAKFTTWLYTICRNAYLKKVRRKKPHMVSRDESLELEDYTVTRQIADSHSPSPSDSTLSNEQAMVVKEAIDSLPESQKTAVILYRYDQLSYEEIARVMDCSVKAVKSLLHRARLSLKVRLEDYFKK